MPFEPAPKPQVGKFQKFADAMLRGCAQTRRAEGTMYRPARFFGLWPATACALGALRVGMGEPMHFNTTNSEELAMRRAYVERYGYPIFFDNDCNGFTREQIAARIAAL